MTKKFKLANHAGSLRVAVTCMHCTRRMIRSLILFVVELTWEMNSSKFVGVVRRSDFRSIVTQSTGIYLI